MGQILAIKTPEIKFIIIKPPPKALLHTIFKLRPI